MTSKRLAVDGTILNRPQLTNNSLPTVVGDGIGLPARSFWIRHHNFAGRGRLDRWILPLQTNSREPT